MRSDRKPNNSCAFLRQNEDPINNVSLGPWGNARFKNGNLLQEVYRLTYIQQHRKFDMIQVNQTAFIVKLNQSHITCLALLQMNILCLLSNFKKVKVFLKRFIRLFRSCKIPFLSIQHKKCQYYLCQEFFCLLCSATVHSSLQLKGSINRL